MSPHLRSAIPALALMIVAFYPAASRAHASNGSDGRFHPIVSTVLDSTQAVFNFTSIYIPDDVTVCFSEVASTRPIELLATETIHVAGTIEAGTNGLWIETPGDIIVSGSLNSIGGPLFLAAARINVPGSVHNAPGGDLYLTALNIAVNGNRDGDRHPTARGDEIAAHLHAGGDLYLTAGDGGLAIGHDRGGGLYPAAGGGDIVISHYGDGILLRHSSVTPCESCLVSAPVPEPAAWIMLTAGLAALRTLSGRRFPRKRSALV